MSETPHRRAKKSLGQHFLTDPNLQRKIADAIDPQPTDVVLEIGAGTGLLTRQLSSGVGKLILVELDDALADELAQQHAGRSDVVVIHADILETSIGDLAGDVPIKVIGNIPYGITSPLLFHLLDQRPRPQRIVLTVQREVAERLAARPGTKQYGALTVGIRAVADVELLFAISRHAFRPRPDVDSMTIRVTPHAPPPLTGSEELDLRTLTRAAFSRRRKQLQRVLRAAPEYALDASAVTALLADLGIDPATRPDALPVDDYIALARALRSGGRWSVVSSR